MSSGPTPPATSGARVGLSGGLVGERVRQTRRRRGMTRKLLARDSGVSERYLAQLRRAKATSRFCCTADCQGARYRRLKHSCSKARSRRSTWCTYRFLRRLPAAELAPRPHHAGATFRRRRSGGAPWPHRAHRVARCWKVDSGRNVGPRLEAPFLELDRLIEQESGVSLSSSSTFTAEADFAASSGAA